MTLPTIIDDTSSEKSRKLSGFWASAMRRLAPNYLTPQEQQGIDNQIALMTQDDYHALWHFKVILREVDPSPGYAVNKLRGDREGLIGTLCKYTTLRYERDADAGDAVERVKGLLEYNGEPFIRRFLNLDHSYIKRLRPIPDDEAPLTDNSHEILVLGDG